MSKEQEPITVDATRPYVVVTWDDENAISLLIGGGIAYDHMVMAGFMVTRQANIAIAQAQMQQQQAAQHGDGGIVPFASIPDALKQRGS